MPQETPTENETALAIVEQPVAINPVERTMLMIERAINNGASFEQVQQLLDMKARVETDEATKAFNQAFSAFKAEAVSIVKNVTVSDGPLKGKKYADLFGVVSAITPILSKHGLSHSWKLTKDEPQWMEVTCTIRHSLGHSESVSMGSGPDTGPGRNAIQARGSAKTYLERYTLLGATGMAASDTDDDGKAAGGTASSGLPVEEFAPLLDNIEAAESDAELTRFYKDAFLAAEKINDWKSIEKFKAAKDKRKKELSR